MAVAANTIGHGRATLAAEVRSEIERLIVEGELAAGEKLNEVSLSSAMGVSRGTVREAIRSLADSGLIDLIANRGAFVHETTLDEVRNLYDLRGAIFGMACAAFAQHQADGHTADLTRKLTTKLERMQKTKDRNDIKAYYSLNLEFHDLILEGAGNPRAKAIYDNTIKEMHLFWRRRLSISTNIARSLEEHRIIGDAIIAGDADAARQAGTHHIASCLRRYMTLVAQPDSEGG